MVCNGVASPATTLQPMTAEKGLASKGCRTTIPVMEATMLTSILAVVAAGARKHLQRLVEGAGMA